jgi:hypothetical protein
MNPLNEILKNKLNSGKMRYTAKILLNLLCITFLVNSESLFSQSPDFLEGKVINSISSKPVPFATIKLRNNQIGVYANADGDFKIIRKQEFMDDSLMITCIGFKQSAIAYKDLLDNSVNKIILNPIVYGLKEVKVVSSRKKLGAPAIIGRAIRNIKNNYPDKPYNYIAYYRDYQKRDSNYINLNEAIIQTLDRGFSFPSIYNRYHLLDFRENTDFPRMNITPYYNSINDKTLNDSFKSIPMATLGDQFGNELFVLMVHDAIRNFDTRSFSFVENFSTDFLYNHSFSEPVTVLNNNLPLYKIDFTGRSLITTNKLEVSGSIYIQPRDYSIHKLEYSVYYKSKKEGLKQMFNIDIEYGYENSIDSRMSLKYISFNNVFNVTDDTDSSYFKILDSYLDTHTNIKTTVVVNFNNKIDPGSVSDRKNYEITIGKRPADYTHVQASGKNLYIRLKPEDLKSGRDSINVSVKNIRDVNGNVLNQKKTIQLHQYRELFVQDYNKNLPLNDSCYIEFKPLDVNCISKYSGSINYWMNTPENIKIKK